jgi:hypothetical protein
MKSSTEVVASILVDAAGLYLAMGIAVAVGIHWRGLARIDPGTRGAGIGFRILITPGLVALWPWLLVVWNRAVRGSGFQGGSAVSPSAGSLRIAHVWAWRILGILVPAALALLLVSRPPTSPPTTLPVPPSTSPETTSR